MEWKCKTRYRRFSLLLVSISSANIKLCSCVCVCVCVRCVTRRQNEVIAVKKLTHIYIFCNFETVKLVSYNEMCIGTSNRFVLIYVSAHKTQTFSVTVMLFFYSCEAPSERFD